ncbi:MAG TPA: DUF1592 domain-containing protein [Polyangiaceae bacterium]|nr:DUF1592 domain-containing protein [Polyangiaceae bacterium]
MDEHVAKSSKLLGRPLWSAAAATALGLAMGCSGVIGGPPDPEPQGRTRPATGTATGTATGAGGATGVGGTTGSGGGTTGTGGPTGTGGGTTGGGGSGAGTAGSGGGPPEPEFAPQSAGLRRLTIAQYRNSIRDLLGADVTVTTELEEDTMLSGFSSIGAARVSLSAKLVEQFETSALAIAKQVLSNTATRGALVGCTPAATTDDACTRTFVTKIGRRAWRRPLLAEEADQYVAIARTAQTQVADFFGGLQYALAGLIQSPFFLYREELGSPDPAQPTRVIFNDYELATRLSFFLWNTTPDDQLLTAADAKQLTAAGGLTTQAQRLLTSDRTPTAMQTFFTELYRLGELDQLSLLPSVFPQMSPTLGAAMRTETLRLLNDIAFARAGDFREVFDTRNTFVNKELASLYGLPAPAGTDFVAATLPDTGMRAGLLGQASFLAVTSQPNRSSPTRRGKFIREMLLCQNIPTPPPDVDPFPDAAPGTAREKLTSHRQNPSCAGCHQIMDPIGLGLENFNGVGAFRTTDNGQAIDATGDLDGVHFAGPRDLALALKNHPDAPTCLARNLYRHATAHLENNGEEAAISLLVKAFRDNGFRFRALVEGMVNSPAFVYAAKPAP